MDIVLIRHPKREPEAEEKTAALSREGRQMAEQLARSLRNLSVGSLFLPARFTIIVTSSYAPAKEMAGLLWRSPQARVRELDCLTPFAPGGDDFSTFFEDLEKSAGSVSDSDAIAIVGHEPRLSRLLSFLTSKASRSLERGEAVWLRAPLNDFRTGRGILQRSTLKTDQATPLREKVQSKMAVCTFLAGFSSAALIEILKESEKMLQFQRIVGAVSFVAAFSLFVGAVYIYDELSMPREFWESAPREPDTLSQGQFGFDWLMSGPLYAHMVRTWRFFFTPALLCTLVGVFALLSANLREWKGKLVWAACAVAVVLASLIYRWFRPKLAID